MIKYILPITILFPILVQAQVVEEKTTDLLKKSQIELEQKIVTIGRQQQEMSAQRKRLQMLIEVKKAEITPSPTPTPTIAP